MPLQDRPDFQAWFARRNQGIVGRTHGDCTGCGNPIDHPLPSDECLVCLAEHFGTETAEMWLAEAISGVVHAAADPYVLSPLLAELIKFARELAEIQTPPDQPADRVLRGAIV